ncbi:hypothetical protein GALMADRAFT_723517 [Galerina marginata CBS 339.88]|uniref:Uncharacterized protein n=1 Tax=Galerina marginata (strain CBS 339.88) TaxID=685588 RepID=A0A067T2B5_GALM3|nr:hypothetical protein GALMADRAFT_723517 [Galerina marginata CBS 339.88]
MRARSMAYDLSTRRFISRKLFVVILIFPGYMVKGAKIFKIHLDVLSQAGLSKMRVVSPFVTLPLPDWPHSERRNQVAFATASIPPSEKRSNWPHLAQSDAIYEFGEETPTESSGIQPSQVSD